MANCRRGARIYFERLRSEIRLPDGRKPDAAHDLGEQTAATRVLRFKVAWAPACAGVTSV